MLIFGIVAATVILLAAVLYFVLLYFFRMAFARVERKERTDEEMYDSFKAKYGEYVAGRVVAGRRFYRTLPKEDVYITSHDGLRLHARYSAIGDGKKVILLAHGYKSYGESDFMRKRGSICSLSTSVRTVKARASISASARSRDLT